tara:strand:- start:243 stop:398 length:156 start_codon:yes stop_codon:yes gene_type:complete
MVCLGFIKITNTNFDNLLQKNDDINHKIKDLLENGDLLFYFWWKFIDMILK